MLTTCRGPGDLGVCVQWVHCYLYSPVVSCEWWMLPVLLAVPTSTVSPVCTDWCGWQFLASEPKFWKVSLRKLVGQFLSPFPKSPLSFLAISFGNERTASTAVYRSDCSVIRNWIHLLNTIPFYLFGVHLKKTKSGFIHKLISFKNIS